MLPTLRCRDSHPSRTVSLTSDRIAPYYKYTVLTDIHAHHEPNYRRAPAGWAGWGMKYADPFAPFANRSPLRHFDRVFMGMHYGAGHTSMKHMGFGNWRMALRTSTGGLLGTALAMFTYWLRMSRNGWEVKNASAVTGA